MTLSAEVRTQSGKGPARQLRMQGKIPAVYYGPGIDPVKLTVSPTDLSRILLGDYRRNQLIELDYGGDKGLALVKDLDINPVSRVLLHADFYLVSREKKVRTTVPFETTGRALGVQKGGTLRKLFRELPIEALPQDVPSKIVHDVTELDVMTPVEVSDLKLPEGVEVSFPSNRRVVFIDFKEAEETEEEEEA
ncbi:MAG: 50S ribosomal protein L25 [Sandaracinaceae bacterium]